MTTAEPYVFSEEERALIPGSPYRPDHTMPRRIAYAGVGLLTGLATTFPNSLVINDTFLFVAVVALLTAMFLMSFLVSGALRQRETLSAEVST